MRKGILAAAVAAAALLFAGPAGAATSHAWATYGSAASTLYSSNAAVTQWAFDPPASYMTNGSSGNITANPNPDGLTAAPVARFTSYATFRSQVASISKTVFAYVMYDNENWSATPTAEQQNPTYYMQQFASLAHAHGFKVIYEPARDLGNVDTACVKQSGWNLNQWYVNCGIARAAGQDSAAGDSLWVQDQADTTDLTGDAASYNYLWDNACTQFTGAFPGGQALTELSSNYGTTAQATAAGENAMNYATCPAGGAYFTIGSGSGGWGTTVLANFKAAGY